MRPEHSNYAGHQAYRAAEDGFERAVSEAQAAGAAACEAAHAAQPIATGVFAEEEVPMDDAFLSELDRLFQTDVCPHPDPAICYSTILITRKLSCSCS